MGDPKGVGNPSPCNGKAELRASFHLAGMAACCDPKARLIA